MILRHMHDNLDNYTEDPYLLLIIATPIRSPPNPQKRDLGEESNHPLFFSLKLAGKEDNQPSTRTQPSLNAVLIVFTTPSISDSTP